MWEILSSADFRTNLLAGAVIFCLEVALLAAFLPWLLQRRLDKRWAPARASFVKSLLIPLDDFFIHAPLASRKLARGEKSRLGPDRWREGEELLRELIQTYSASFNPDLARGAASLVEFARRGRLLMILAPIAVANGKDSSNREQFLVCVRGMTDQIENMQKAVGATLQEGWRSTRNDRFERNYDWLVKDLKNGISG